MVKNLEFFQGNESYAAKLINLKTKHLKNFINYKVIVF